MKMSTGGWMKDETSNDEEEMHRRVCEWVKEIKEYVVVYRFHATKFTRTSLLIV